MTQQPNPRSWRTPGAALMRDRAVLRIAAILSKRTRTPGATPAQGNAHYYRWKCAVGEAQSLLTLETNGCSSINHIDPCERFCRDISDVMDVEPGVAESLEAFATEFPEEREMIDESVRFREMVAVAIEEIHAQEVARSAA